MPDESAGIFICASNPHLDFLAVTMNTDFSTLAAAPLQPQPIPLDPGKPVHVIPYRHEEPLFWISVYFAITLWLVMLVFTLGLIIPIMLLLGLLGMFAHSLLIAWLKGNSVKVTAQQLPDLYALYQQTCARLGMQKQPELYLAQSDGMLNAMATRFMRRDYVVLLSAVVEALADRPQAIKFYMGHELGHIKRKHLSRHWWLWPGMLYPLLSPAYSRAREYTCDRHGFASCDNLDDAKRALAVLVAGPDLWKKLNLNAFEAQSQETGNFWMAVNELTADYPWLCKRMMVLENRNAVFPKRSFFAWMIALLSPRMGYGGAIIGFLYWLMLGILILVLVAALAFSGSNMSWLSGLKSNPIVNIWKKMMDLDSKEESESSSSREPQDAATSIASQDDAQLEQAFDQLSGVLTSVNVYMEKNQNRAPGSLEILNTESTIDAGSLQYRVLDKAEAKRMPGVQLFVEKTIVCQSCDTTEPKVQFRRDQAGNWSCHVAGIPAEMLDKQTLKCDVMAAK